MRDRLPQTRTDALMAARTGHITVLRELLPYIWPAGRPDLRWRVVWALAALVVAKVITLAVPIAYKAVVDLLTGEASGKEITAVGLAAVPAFLIIAYGVGRVLMVVFSQFRDIWFTVVAQNAVRQLAKRTFRHLHALSLRFHLERRTGGLNRVIERGVTGVDTIVRMAVLNSIPTAVELLMISGLVAYYFGWLYVLVVFVTVGLYVWFTFWASELRINIRRDMNESDTEAHSKAVDSLLNYETVKYFGNEDLEARRFDASMARYEKAAIRTYTSLGVLNTGQAVIFTGGLVACMLLAARDVAAGVLTIGDFVMINAILMQLYLPLNFMGMVYREIKQGLIDIETMFALLHEPPEIVDRPGAKPLVVRNGAIKFENVSFSYDPERQILKNISFEVPPGRMVAIVGPSGAGKSTISRILFRFYDISSGRVLIDGQNIKNVTQASLRAAIGMVPQDTVLFNDTIEYNIRYGKPDATAAEVREARSLLHLNIARFPAAIADVVADGVVEQHGVLRHDADGGAQARLRHGPDVLAVDQHAAAGDVVEAEQDARDGGFAGA
jgi:ATP-binding cassette, subfamily B, heavy metal transporter